MRSTAGENSAAPQVNLSDRAFRAYKLFVSPMLHAVAPGRCRYLPTCSEYAYTALVRFGVLKGSWLALRRLLRCHPWAQGGVDPVPGTAARSEP
jgi:putative membrane protein insertion efficiency factor